MKYFTGEDFLLHFLLNIVVGQEKKCFSFPSVIMTNGHKKAKNNPRAVLCDQYKYFISWTIYWIH